MTGGVGGPTRSPHSFLSVSGGVALVSWRRHPQAKRISLRIDPKAGQVIVTLPTRVTRAAGLALLERNADWVCSRLSALPDVPGFAAGVTVEIGGVPHLIRRAPGKSGGAWLEPGLLMVGGNDRFLARRVGDFLRAEAARRLAMLARAKASQAGVTVRGVRVRDTTSRWGSCSPTGALMFCWRVLMAPPLVQDYVVAHEVAHLRHLNHGKAFWILAEQLSPHREAAEAWLAREGPRLLRVA